MMELAALEAGFLDVKVILGEREPDLAEAERLWLLAAESGEPAAYGMLADMSFRAGDADEVRRYSLLGLAAAPRTFEILDAEEVAARSEDFVIPPREMRERFSPGVSVKLLWSDGANVERMWAQILLADGGRYVGFLDNDPADLDLRRGTLVEFGPEHIMGRPLTDEEQTESFRRMADTGERIRTMPDGVSLERYDEIMRLAEGGDLEAIEAAVVFAERREDEAERRRWLARAVELGDAKAMVILGSARFEDGDLDQATGLWERAAGLGQPVAMYLLGATAGNRDDEEEAERWFRRGAEAGETSSMAALGQLLIERDTVEARTWLERAVAKKNPEAMVQLSRLELADGDEDHARTLLALAAELGNEVAAQILQEFEGFQMREKLILEFSDASVVAERTRQADDGDEDALWWLVNRARHLEDAAERERLLVLGCDRGLSWAVDLLGDLRADEGDQEAAVALWRQAAESGNPDSMYSLGFAALDEGDRPGAIAWFDQGMDRNHAGCAVARAQIALEDESEEATILLRRAIELGSTPAKTLLGIVLMQAGQREEGGQLIVEAANEGDENAQRILSEGGGDGG
jgi:TPR repeat protein